MKNEKKSKIDWLNIIFDDEFQNYLNLDMLKEISILSKLVRLKLSTKLFDSIKLKEKYERINGESERYYKLPALTELDRIISSASKGTHKDLDVERLISGFKSEIKGFSRFVSSLYLKRLNFVGYQLFPIFESFSNLTILILHDCTIPYSSIASFGVSFPKLKSIELISILLVKLPADSTYSKNFIFPLNLIYLKISMVQATEPGSLFNPYDQLFDGLELEDIYNFQFPIIQIPSLKRLDFDNDYDEDHNLEDFLDINPNLESLVVENFYLDKDYIFKSIKSLSILKVNCIDNESDFSTQEVIEELAIYIEKSRYFNNVSKLCLLCPNLKKLQFSMMSIDDYQLTFDSFLIPILAKLPKLKTLHLEVNTFKSDILNINKFLHVEDIVFGMFGPNILNIKFDNCKKLKSIEFNSNSIENLEYVNEFKQLFQKVNNWKFKYYKYSIKGFKIL